MEQAREGKWDRVSIAMSSSDHVGTDMRVKQI